MDFLLGYRGSSALDTCEFSLSMQNEKFNKGKRYFSFVCKVMRLPVFETSYTWELVQWLRSNLYLLIIVSVALSDV